MKTKLVAITATVRQREALGEHAMAEKIRQIFMQEQDDQIDWHGPRGGSSQS
jgi:hypothetical protein